MTVQLTQQTIDGLVHRMWLSVAGDNPEEDPLDVLQEGAEALEIVLDDLAQCHTTLRSIRDCINGLYTEGKTHE